MKIHPYEVVQHWARIQPEAIAFRTLKVGSQPSKDFVELSWLDIFDRLQKYGRFLSSFGLSSGDRIGLFGKNSLDWILVDWAAMSLGLVTVPISSQSHPDELRYILQEADVQILFCDSTDPHLFVRQLTFAEFEKRSLQLEAAFEPRFPAPDDLCTIIYTSGTAGNPKGVMHSLRSIRQAVETATEILNLNRFDHFLAYLTFSHVAERMLVEFGALYSGGKVSLLDRVEKLSQYLTQIRPTIFLAVPRIWDLIQLRIDRELSAKPILRRNLEKVPSLLRRTLMGPIIRRKLGLERCRFFLSGAAKLNPETSSFFFNWGLDIHEAYGLTETLCVSSICHPGEIKIGSVGKIYPGVQIKILDDGEICLKAPFHFLGYYQHPEWTKEALVDGWFHTGDMGSLDVDGNLWITDRKKSLFKTTNGKYVAPLPIEQALKTHPAIHELLVYGDGKPHCVALASLKEKMSVTEAELSELLDRVNTRLPVHEQIKSVGVVPATWSVASGELTPSMKLKRKVVIKKFEKEMEDLYESRAKVKFFPEAYTGDKITSAHSGF